ncbi:MAG TPA: homoserine dehydrogenase [Chthoniobacteraceae bacterium]|nr:homoserine dehydrogenase [Chthoniobacteraceae bacterium]
MRQIGIGIAGFGTVGAGVYKHLSGNRRLLCERLGLELEVKRIAVRDLTRPRPIPPPASMTTGRWEDLIEDPEVEIIVELMGGVETPRALVLAAIEKRKIVVTGNKALLAEHGKEIFEAALRHRVPIFFEAAVAGGVPIVKAIREAFVGNHILSMHGIINGTCNYILTQMTQTGLSFETALEQAKEAGFAEADPTLDINGWDAAHKAIILASLAYGFWVPGDQIHVEGIEEIRAADIGFACKLGYVIKLLATVKADANHAVEVRVQPTLVPKSHVLASVNGVFNAVAVQGDVVGDTLFYGRGAGQDPTASAVISDIAEAAVALQVPRAHFGFTPHGLYGQCRPVAETVSPYYLRLSVVDRPGVLAQVAGILSEMEIGIASMFQPEALEEEATPLVLMLHEAPLGRIREAMERLSALPWMSRPPRMIRVLC